MKLFCIALFAAVRRYSSGTQSCRQCEMDRPVPFAPAEETCPMLHHYYCSLESFGMYLDDRKQTSYSWSTQIYMSMQGRKSPP